MEGTVGIWRERWFAPVHVRASKDEYPLEYSVPDQIQVAFSNVSNPGGFSL